MFTNKGDINLPLNSVALRSPSVSKLLPKWLRQNPSSNDIQNRSHSRQNRTG